MVPTSPGHIDLLIDFKTHHQRTMKSADDAYSDLFSPRHYIQWRSFPNPLVHMNFYMLSIQRALDIFYECFRHEINWALLLGCGFAIYPRGKHMEERDPVFFFCCTCMLSPAQRSGKEEDEDIYRKEKGLLAHDLKSCIYTYLYQGSCTAA